MTYPFLNFWVGVGQRGFQIKGVKSVPSNLFRIVESPVDWSSDKQAWLYLEQIVVLTSLSKHTKDFQVIVAFGHSSFITSQSLFVTTNVLLKRYLACRTFSKCQPYSNESCLCKRTYTYEIDDDNQLHHCIRGARCLSRWRCYKYTCKITAEKNNWIAIALITLHHYVKVNYSKSI